MCTLRSPTEAPKAGGEGSQVTRISPLRDVQHHIDPMATGAQLELDISSLDLTGVIEQLPNNTKFRVWESQQI